MRNQKKRLPVSLLVMIILTDYLYTVYVSIDLGWLPVLQVTGVHLDAAAAFVYLLLRVVIAGIALVHPKSRFALISMIAEAAGGFLLVTYDLSLHYSMDCECRMIPDSWLWNMFILRGAAVTAWALIWLRKLKH